MSSDNSKIEQLKKGLYSRGGSDILHKEVRFKAHHDDVSGEWQGEPEEEEIVIKNESRDEVESSSFFKHILWAAVIFFLLALGFAFYVLFAGKNTVSADNVNILVAGPVSVAGGEPLNLDIKVENNNNVKLELVDLSIEYPSGTANPADITQEQRRYRELLGDIVPRDSATKKVSAVLFGEENSKKEIRITAEYRVEGSNAVFSKEKIYDVFISSAPVSITVESLDEVNANQQTTLKLTVTSNSARVAKNLLVKADYPFGFSFKKSDPTPAYNNNTWKIGDLPPGAKKTILITGAMEGQNEEERVFHFNLGIQSPRDAKIIGTQFMTAVQSILVKKPFVTTTLALGGDEGVGDYAGQLDKVVKADINWTNNTPADIIDAVIRVKINGTILDKTSVQTDGGFYRSSDNTITWDKTNTSVLGMTHSGDSGHVTFSFIPRASSYIGSSGLRNPEVSIDVSFGGRRVSEGNVPESILSSASRKVKMVSELGFASRLVRSVGPFPNTGPFPPKADQESTYTVIWTIANTSSTIANAQVKATLPSYVKWVGRLNPPSENISYDQVSGLVTWSPGEIPAGTGYSLSAREVAFQVAFTPSQNQIGQSPNILGDAVLSGVDKFTGATLENAKGILSTRLSTDPLFQSGNELVQE